MTESKADAAPHRAKELLALNPKQESEFKKKVQEAKRDQSIKVKSSGTSGEIRGLKEPRSRQHEGLFFLLNPT